MEIEMVRKGIRSARKDRRRRVERGNVVFVTQSV